METKKLISRSDYLLPQSLEDLHRQSGEWLETLAFWKDETRFFGDLLKRQRESLSEPSDFTTMLPTLDKLHQSLFEYLTEEIMAHERLLSRAIQGEAGMSDADYREGHRKLAVKVQEFEQDFRAFKKMVFGYAKKW